MALYDLHGPIFVYVRFLYTPLIAFVSVGVLLPPPCLPFLFWESRLFTQGPVYTTPRLALLYDTIDRVPIPEMFTIIQSLASSVWTSVLYVVAYRADPEHGKKRGGLVVQQ